MTHPRRHECNAWCRDGRHVNVNYSTVDDDAIVDDFRRWYAQYGLDVLHVEPAAEAPPPPDDPTTPSWWPALGAEVPADGPIGFRHAYLVTFEEARDGR